MRRIFLLTVVLAFAGAGVAGAQEAPERGVRFYGLGPRVGFSIDPDQFVFGGHLDMGDPFPHFTWLIPVVEIGIGDNRTLTNIATDLYYRFYDRWGVWTPYLGGELGIIIANPDAGDSDTELGFSGLFGVEKGIGENRFALELKFKIVDAPDFKLAASWTFGH